MPLLTAATMVPVAIQRHQKKVLLADNCQIGLDNLKIEETRLEDNAEIRERGNPFRQSDNQAAGLGGGMPFGERGYGVGQGGVEMFGQRGNQF
uniref:Uncharacterized protein n=1 Tax=Globodera pallida TaxID=36090 RepID=A0A183BZD9_GLOPA